MLHPSKSSLDIVIPIYNEEAVLDLLWDRIDKVFTLPAREGLGLGRVRYIFVDDGSRDRSAALIAERIRSGASAVLYRLSRNFGHQAAVAAGLDHADADAVAVMDADLQDPPEELPPMLVKWRSGSHVVFGVRTNRKEHLLKRWAYAGFYRVLHYLSEGLIPRDSGDFCVMDRAVVAALRRLPEKQRFVRGLRAWVGFRHTSHLYERGARAGGSSKYSLAALYRLATDGLASSSVRPLRIAQLLAIIFIVVSGLVSVFAVVNIARDGSGDPGRILACLHLALTGAIGFAVLFCLYILSAYVADRKSVV